MLFLRMAIVVLCLIAVALGEDVGMPGVDDAAEGMGSGCGCNALTRDAANDALDGEDGAERWAHPLGRSDSS